MIVQLTPQDKRQLTKIENEYDHQITEIQALIKYLAPAKGLDHERYRELQRSRPPRPEPDSIDSEGNPVVTKKALDEWYNECSAIDDEIHQMHADWLASGSQEWRDARKKEGLLITRKAEAVQTFFRQIERREFAKLGGDKKKILANAEEQVNLLIDRRIQMYEQAIATHKSPGGEEVVGFSARELRVDGDQIYLDSPSIIMECKLSLLTLHYEALSYDPEAIDRLTDIVIATVTNSPKTSSSKGILGANYDLTDKETFNLKSKLEELEEITISYPASYITPIDKVSNKAFEGVLNSPEPIGVEVIKKAKTRRPIYTLVSIDIAELEGVRINGRKELTAFDREIHDAIVTLFVEGGNTYITTNMIYQMMTGKKDSHCSPKQAQAISDSITKLMYSHAVIDSSDEAKVRGIDKAKYDSNLVNAKRITISANGQTAEAIKILDTPILYDYAVHRNQIGRFDVKLLDSPVNKTEDNIILDGYLRRRILAMKGPSKLSTTIKYDTVYKQIDIVAGSESALRNKKMKIRNTVKRLLDFYKKEGFIAGYVENSRKAEKNKIDSVTIRV